MTGNNIRNIKALLKTEIDDLCKKLGVKLKSTPNRYWYVRGYNEGYRDALLFVLKLMEDKK